MEIASWSAESPSGTATAATGERSSTVPIESITSTTTWCWDSIWPFYTTSMEQSSGAGCYLRDEALKKFKKWYDIIYIIHSFSSRSRLSLPCPCAIVPLYHWWLTTVSNSMPTLSNRWSRWWILFMTFNCRLYGIHSRRRCKNVYPEYNAIVRVRWYIPSYGCNLGEVSVFTMLLDSNQFRKNQTCISDDGWYSVSVGEDW